MIAAYVRFALSPKTDLGGALMCFDEDPDTLRPYDSPMHWARPCMAGALRRTAAGDVDLWPRQLRPAVLRAVSAGRGALACGRHRGLQASAYTAAHDALFAGDLEALIISRLARQLMTDSSHPLLRTVARAFSSLGPRSSFLATRGATNSVCTGARMQAPERHADFALRPPTRWLIMPCARQPSGSFALR